MTAGGASLGTGVLVAAILLGAAFAAGGLGPEPAKPAGPAAAQGPPAPPTPSGAPESGARLTPGTVVSDTSAATRTGPVQLGRSRTVDGATAAFTSYADWLVGSPAAKSEPEGAVDVVASDSLSPADKQLIRGMARDKTISLDPRAGAYRVLGRSGDGDTLSAVMIEMLTPITYGPKTRWIVVGGVVSWRDDGWKVDSMMPREVKQPPAAASANRSAAATAAQESLEMPGLGWQTYTNAVNR